jgi:hypothetical protein
MRHGRQRRQRCNGDLGLLRVVVLRRAGTERGVPGGADQLGHHGRVDARPRLAARPAVHPGTLDVLRLRGQLAGDVAAPPGPAARARRSPGTRRPAAPTAPSSPPGTAASIGRGRGDLTKARSARGNDNKRLWPLTVKPAADSVRAVMPNNIGPTRPDWAEWPFDSRRYPAPGTPFPRPNIRRLYRAWPAPRRGGNARHRSAAAPESGPVNS